MLVPTGSRESTLSPLILPLGDTALLVRFADHLTDAANAAAIGFAARLEAAGLRGVLEVVPNLVSVLVRYDTEAVSYASLAGEIRLLSPGETSDRKPGQELAIPVAFDGEDLSEVAATLQLSVEAFIAAHNALPLRVLSTGFAPGFIYAGMHGDSLVVPRRTAVRPQVPAGTVLFAAGQTALTSTAIPTGWHVIGHTSFRNFDPAEMPPTRVTAGDLLRFEAA